MKYGLSSSTPQRMSAPSSVCSDDSFEIVNHEVDIEEPKDDVFSIYKPKVTFHELFDVYPMDADIVAKVSFDHDYFKSDQDTVVVLPIAWKSIDQALCTTTINGRCVRFDMKDLPKIGAEDKFYQLCYCTPEKIVMGVSIPFSFREVHENELVEFHKEQNKEFWTFRSRFAVLTDYYWNSLMEKQLNKLYVEGSGSNSNHESASVIDTAQNTSLKNNHGTTELLQTSNYFLAEVNNKEPEKDVITKCVTDEKSASEPPDNYVTAQKDILLFKCIENEKTKNENLKLKALVFEIAHAVSINDRETSQRELMNTVNGFSEIFTDKELFELRELLKGLIEPTVVKSPDKTVSFLNLSDGGTSNDSSELANEKILLFKIMENENAELKKQYEEEQVLHTDARNTAKDLKDILIEILNTTSLQDRVRQKIENSLPFISAAFNDKELEQVREILKKSGTETINEIVKGEICKFEAGFVGTSDGSVILVDHCEKQKSGELVNPAALVADQLIEKDEEIKILNFNLLDASKLLTENEREIRNLKARDNTFVGFLERRNLKKISKLRETLQEMNSKSLAERQESIKLKEDLLITQTLLNSLCDEQEKSSNKKSMENSAQTSDNICNKIPSMSVGFHKIKQREQALGAKLVEMTAELEKMRVIYNENKTDLEARLKDGAKQYAKLFMKYEKLMKRSQTPFN